MLVACDMSDEVELSDDGCRSCAKGSTTVG